ATARRIMGTTLNGTAPAEIWFTAPVRYRSGSGFRSMSSSSSVSSRSTVIAFQPGAPGVRVEGAAEKPLDENGTRGRARRGEDHVAVAAAHGGVEEVVAVEPREEVTRDHGRPQVGVVVRRVGEKVRKRCRHQEPLRRLKREVSRRDPGDRKSAV